MKRNTLPGAAIALTLLLAGANANAHGYADHGPRFGLSIHFGDHGRYDGYAAPRRHFRRGHDARRYKWQRRHARRHWREGRHHRRHGHQHAWRHRHCDY